MLSSSKLDERELHLPVGKTAEVEEEKGAPRAASREAEALASAREIEGEAVVPGLSLNTKAQRVAVVDRTVMPSRYRSVSAKEELVEEYVENFRRQFVTLYPARKPLLLYLPNECGTNKLVCTTVRPTQLPYRELYYLPELARFVAHFLDYEALPNPLAPPINLPSPGSVIEWRLGDSFDFANLLTSYLLGVGYDAYVVNGYAPREVCLRDQSRAVCPILLEEKAAEEAAVAARAAEEEDSKDAAGESKYAFSRRGPPRSTFLAREAEKAAAEAAAKLKAAELDDEDDEEAPLPSDALAGKRVHAWVLVRGGKRELAESVMVEATTGVVYKLDEAPYDGVETVWNSQNYWVNMKPDAAVADMSFDLTDTDSWEFVFIDPSATDDSAVDDADLDDDGLGGDEAEKEEEEDERILDLPPSWCKKPAILREEYSARYGQRGSVQVLYRKAKLELFAENVDPLGLQQRLTLYKDIHRVSVKEVREDYDKRRDKLWRRVRYPLQGKVHEFFKPGRVHAMKEYIEVTGLRREILFYTSARYGAETVSNGLVRRVEEIGKKMTETFEGRDDHLVYRSVSLDSDPEAAKTHQGYMLPAGPLGELVIRKMTQRFARNEDVPAERDVVKRTFAVKEGWVRIEFHYAPGHITAEARTYQKDRSKRGIELVVGGDGDGSVTEAEAAAVLQQEKMCWTALRDSQRETNDILLLRRREEDSMVLEKTVFETARERAAEDSKHEHTEEEEEEADERIVDYLTPFLVSSAGDPKNPTREEAAAAKSKCLKALRERLLERANIIQQRLNEENSNLVKKQQQFQRSREHMEGQDEEFQRYCTDAVFRITILEQRLVRHEESALAKFTDMDDKLSRDPRLAVLHGGLAKLS